MANEQATARWWFIYYRVRRGDVSSAAAAVRAAQRALCDAQPGLAATLMQRPSSDEAEVTLLESYSVAAPWPEARLAAVPSAIDATVTPAAAPWQCGPRHLEVFSPCA